MTAARTRWELARYAARTRYGNTAAADQAAVIAVRHRPNIHKSTRPLFQGLAAMWRRLGDKRRARNTLLDAARMTGPVLP